MRVLSFLWLRNVLLSFMDKSLFYLHRNILYYQMEIIRVIQIIYIFICDFVCNMNTLYDCLLALLMDISFVPCSIAYVYEYRSTRQ